MMGPRQETQAALFYEFCLEDHVPQDHMLRLINRFVDLSDIRQHLASFYSSTGRPSIDPELMIPRIKSGAGFCCWSAIAWASGLNDAYVTRFI